MGSLFDELKKAKIIDEKRAKQLAHERRVEKKSKGGDVGEDAEQDKRREEFAASRKQERKQKREAERQRLAEERERERFAQLRQQVASRQLGDEAMGRRRWHFEAPDHRLPCLTVSDPIGRRLEAGELGIVCDPNYDWPRYVIVPREVALALRGVDPKLVCCLNGA